ncbi:MAG: YncE family protein [Terriglobales bacterium]
MNFGSRAWAMTIVLILTAFAIADGPGYHVINSYKLGGEGGWDYLTLDSQSRLLYISRGTHVIVLDADSGTVEGDIPDTPGVHGIALAPDLGRGFVSNGREGTVTIFDIKSLKLISKVKVGENPDAILYDSATKRVFTFNGRSHDSSAIDATNGTVLATIKLDGKPEFAVSDGKGMIFDNIEDKSELTEIDARSLQVKSTWPLAPCESPSGLAIDRNRHVLFSGCENEMMAMVNADNGKVITTLPIGKGVDATRFDPGTGLAFASCGDGHLTVIKEESENKFAVVENVSTQEGARTMALDRKTHRVYLVTAKFGPPPPPTPERPHPWHSIVPDTFTVLVVGK